MSLRIGLLLVQRTEPIAGSIECPSGTQIRLDTILGFTGSLANEICGGPQRSRVSPAGP